MTTNDPKVDAQIGRARRLQYWLIAAAALVAVAAVVQQLIPEPVRWVPVAVNAIAAFAAVILTARKTAAETRARDRLTESERTAKQLARAERERSAILFGYNVREVLSSIDSLAARPPAERATEAPAVRQSVAVQTKEGVSARSSRAAYFRVQDLTATSRVAHPDKVASSADRHDRFTAVFREDDPLHADVWRVLDGSRGAMRVPVVSEWDRSRGVERDRQYGTFITVRVEAGGIPFGVLTVNATNPNSLVEDDVFYVEALARILGIVELLCLTSIAYSRALEATRARAATMSSPGRTLPEDEGNRNE